MDRLPLPGTETTAAIAKWSDVAEAWLHRHLRAVVILMAVSGLLLRLHQAVAFYLNPDEAWQLLLALPSGPGALSELLKNSAKVIHPPLSIVLLGLLARLGREEWLLRLFPVLAGVSFPVLVMALLRRLAGSSAGICACALLMFSPSLIGLSAEVRGYMPAFLLVSIGVWFLESALQRSRLSPMAAFHAWLCAALLTEVCVVWIAGTLGFYALLQLWRKRAPLRIWVLWSIGQLAALGLCAALYVIQIRQPSYKLELEAALTGWLWPFFFHQGGSPVRFLLRSTSGVFEYFSGSREMGVLFGVLWLVGLYRLWRNRSWIGATILVLPFGLGAMGAMLRLLPYGASRHSAYLCIFIAAGMGIAIASLGQGKLVPALTVTGSLLIAANILEVTPFGTIPKQRHQLTEMRSAVVYLLSQAPPGANVLTDRGTAMMLAYYLRSGDSAILDREPYQRREVRGLNIIEAPTFDFLNQEELTTAIAETRRRYGPTAPLWVAAGGFAIRVNTPPDQIRSFSRVMTVFQVPPDRQAQIQ